LNEHILLRINKNERRAVGLTFFEYSLLAQKTYIGPRSFPLTGLSEISDDLREIVLDIIQHPPVSDILSLSAYTPSVIIGSSQSVTAKLNRVAIVPFSTEKPPPPFASSHG
jgi:hypothetical protein